MKRLLLVWTIIISIGIVVGGAYIINASRPSLYEKEDNLAPSRAEIDNSINWTSELEKVVGVKNDTSENTDGFSNLSATEDFSRELFSIFIEKLQKGESVSDIEELTALIDYIIEREGFWNEKTSNDISGNIITNATENEIRNYGNEMGEVIINNSFRVEHEIDLLHKVMAENQAYYLSELKRISKGYEAIAKDALKLNVPESALDIHLKTLNSMRVSAKTVDAFSTVQEDPLKAMIALEIYFENAKKAAEAFSSATTYFNKLGIKYLEDESGSAYTFMKE